MGALPLQGARAADDRALCDGVGANSVESIQACTRLIEAGRDDPLLPDFYLNRGNAHFRSGDFASAIRDFDEAINRRPDFAGAFENRGRAKLSLGDFDAALADFNRAIKLNPGSADYYNVRGAVLNYRGEYDRAVVDFDEALRINPKFVNAYNNRAYSYVRKRLRDLAVADYNSVIRLAPGDARGYVGRASVLMDMAKLDAAVADLDKALQIDPKNSEAYRIRGEARRLQRDLARALTDDDQAVRLSSDDDKARINRALVFRDRQEFDRALADLDEAILHNPKSDLAYADRGEIWRLRGDLDRSLADLDKAVALNPKSPVALTLRGDTLRARGELDRALRDYDEAIRIVSDYVAAYTGRGLVLEQKGDLAAAQAEFAKALRLSADADADKAKPAQRTAQDHLVAVQRALAEQARKREQEARLREAEKARQQQPSLPPLPDQGRRVALVIGNSAYRSVPFLPNPGKDAEGVAQTLRALGFDSVTLLEDATLAQMKRALRVFQDEADKADWAMVYYAGHGIEIGGRNYLIPIDARLESDRDADDEAVPLEQVLSRIHNARKLHLVILDACRENPFQGIMKREIAGRAVRRGLAPFEPRIASEMVVYAAKDGEQAADGEAGHSPFAAALIARLPTPRTEINKIFRLVTSDVLRATNNRQQPFVYGSTPGEEDFYFNSK